MIRTQTYTASDAGLGANSHLLIGDREVMLVDTQFLISEAKKVVDLIHETGKRLTTIFVTHEHPDHHFGTRTLKTAFPDARVLARPETVAAIDRTAAAKMEQWRPVYGADIPATYERPEVHDAATLSFEGRTIDLLDLGAGESETGTALHLREDKLLLSADFVYRDVFAWIVANHAAAWLRTLERLDRLAGVETVLPGHGPSSGREAIRGMGEYLPTFADVVASSPTPEAAKGALRRRFPGHRLAIMMEMSVDDAFSRKG
jgi:glyoxylase-like metal-dependent hydrolase (beta-lactamase superfamily II)